MRNIANVKSKTFIANIWKLYHGTLRNALIVKKKRKYIRSFNARQRCREIVYLKCSLAHLAIVQRSRHWVQCCRMVYGP